MSDKNETLLIEIYKEQVASWKHEDNILYKFGAVLLPVSFIALGIPYVKVIGEPTLTILEIISTTGGIILMTFWFAYVQASHAKINARFEIINQMEKKWEVEGHKDIPEKRDTRYGSPRLFPLKTRFLESSIFYVYWSMALLLTVCRLYAKCAISSKSLLITSLIPFDVICICFVIAVLYHSRTWRGDKQRNS